MTDYGIKISLPGKEVTSTDERDLVMSSKYETFKVFHTGTAQYTFGNQASTQTLNITHLHTFNHNLGYRPQFFFYWNEGSNYGSDFRFKYDAGQSATIIYIFLDETQFRIDYWYSNLGGGTTDLAAKTFNFKYYIIPNQSNAA